jgi:phosphoglycolate phosphatase
MKSCRAVLFDLDGTLLDTLEDLADSVNAVLAARSLPQHAVDAYRYFVGDGATILMTRVLPAAHRTQATIAACVGEFTEVYAEHWNKKTKPYPGIPGMLDALVRRNISISVLSNKPHAYTRLCVEHLLPQWKFDVILGQGGDVPRKPDPGGALQVAAQVHVSPEDVLYVGDTGTDMQTAVAARMLPLGALWGFRTKEELLASGARAVVDSPGGVLHMIESWPSLVKGDE